MKKVILPFYSKIDGNFIPVHVEIEFTNKRLSLSGVVGAMANGNCKGSCGQIKDMFLDFFNGEESGRIAKEYNLGVIMKIYEIWERWHLNDMNAGVPEQEKFIREWKKSNKYDYTKACEALKEVGLYEIDGYKYGHSWIFEEVPQNVIDFLFSLPDAEIRCKWH